MPAAAIPRDASTHAGREAYIANVAMFEETFDEFRPEPIEFVDLDEKVVVVVSMSGRGPGSSAPMETTLAQLWSFRDGRAVSLRDYATKEEALESVGLRD